MKRVVTGPRAALEALRASNVTVHAVYVLQMPKRDAGKNIANIVQEAERRDVHVEVKSARELDSLAKGHRHQNVVAVTGGYPYVDLATLLREAGESPFLIALDQITDPHNFGAIVRSAVVFGAHGVITMKDRACPVTPVVVRSSAGATEHARITRVTNLARTLEELEERGIESIGLDAAGVTLVGDLQPTASGRCLVVGAEGKGLRRLVKARCSLLAKIPQVGPVESLNASVAASIALYQLRELQTPG